MFTLPVRLKQAHHFTAARRDWTVCPALADNVGAMLRAGQIMMLTAVALLGLGVVMTQSAGMTIGGDANHDAVALLTGRQALYAVLALGAMWLASRLDVREIFRRAGWRGPVFWLVLASLVAVGLTQVPGLSRTVNGATRWLYLGPRSWGLSFQPSELLKLTLVAALAGWGARHTLTMHKFFDGLLPPLILTGLACGLVVLEDLGTAALLGVVALALLLAAGGKWWQLLLPVALGVAAFAALIYFTPWRVARLTAFLDPWDAANANGYHPIQSMLAIAQGELTGRGLGNGVQKFGYLPEDTTDFIFAVICEELGLAGALLVTGLYALLLWTGLSVVRACQDQFGRLLALGLTLMICAQALINLLVVVVLVPTKGIALPLVSSGGTGWIIGAFNLGLVAALDNANALRCNTASADADHTITDDALAQSAPPESPESSVSPVPSASPG